MLINYCPTGNYNPSHQPPAAVGDTTYCLSARIRSRSGEWMTGEPVSRAKQCRKPIPTPSSHLTGHDRMHRVGVFLRNILIFRSDPHTPVRGVSTSSKKYRLKAVVLTYISARFVMSRREYRISIVLSNQSPQFRTYPYRLPASTRGNA